jgi:hypothetical protein
MRDDEIRELFGEMREEAVPAESLARVRRAVAERVSARRRWFPAWKVAAMLAVAGVLAVVMVRVRTGGPVQNPVVQAPVVQAPVVQAPVVAQSSPEVAPAAPVVHKAEHRVVPVVAKPVRHVEAPPGVSPDTGGAHEIRIESDEDPDVVIVLIGG